MESHETWTALQSHLSQARTRLDAGDHAAALESVDAALAIDPAFLAAHSLRQRIELDSAKALPPPRQTPGEVVPTERPALESSRNDTPVLPVGRRFGLLLADVYEKKRTVSRDDRLDTTGDSFRRDSESLGRTEFVELRLHEEDRAGFDDAFSEDRPPATSRGPRLVFIAAGVLAVLIAGEGRLRIPSFDFDFAALVPSLGTDKELLAARRLDGPVVGELVAGGTGFGRSARPIATDVGISQNDAPTIRTVTVSALAPASAPRLATATAGQPDSAPTVRPNAPTATPPVASDAEPTARAVDRDAESPSPRPAESTGVVPAVSTTSASDEQSVKTALQRYRTAYERLDAKSARTVWPSVDEAALARAFGGLQSQTLTFTTCDIAFSGRAAIATCEGSTKYTTRYGSRDPRDEPRVWTFTLRKLGAEWKIDSVKAGR